MAASFEVLLDLFFEQLPTTEPVVGGQWWNDNGVMRRSIGLPPAITDQPDDVTVVQGQTATFAVVATNASAYQWQKQESGAGPWNPISGATAASYTTGTLTNLADSTDRYRCVVTGPGGSVTSNAATLTVNLPIPPTIATQPSNASAVEGETATFAVVATNASAYQWQKQESGAGPWNPISGATAASYTTPALTVAADSNDRYRCVVTGPGGTVTSNAATLLVSVGWQTTTAPAAPVISGMTVRALWQTPYGSPTMLKDAVGNFDLIVNAGQQMELITETPSGRPCVYFDGDLELVSNTLAQGANVGVCLFVRPEVTPSPGRAMWGFGGSVATGLIALVSENLTMLLRNTAVPGTTFAPSVQWFCTFLGENSAGSPNFNNNNGTVFSGGTGSRTGFVLGNTVPGDVPTFRFRGWIFGGVVFDLPDVSHGVVTNLANKLARYWFGAAAAPTPVAGQKLLAITGDSISVGAGLTYADSPPGRLEEKLHNWNVYSVGFPASSTASHIQGDVDFIDPFYSGARDRNVAVMIGEPTNEILFGASGATALASIRQWSEARKAAGFESMICTVFERTDFNLNPTMEAARLAYNASLRSAFNVATSSPYVFLPASGTTWADKMIDMDLVDPTTYDGIHPDYRGAELLAREVAIAAEGWDRTLPPVFSSPSKRFNVTQSIAISSGTTGAVIYYTTDGTDPTVASNQYTGPIAVSATVSIKAIAIRSGLPNSEIVTRTYTKVNSQIVNPNWQVTNGSPSISGNRVTFPGQNENVYSSVIIDATEDFSIVGLSASTDEDAIVVALDTEIGSVTWGNNDDHVSAYFVWGDVNGRTVERVSRSGTSFKLLNVTLSPTFRVRMRKVDNDAYIDTSTDSGATWVNRDVQTDVFRNLTSVRLKMYSVFPGATEAWIEELV